MAVSRLGLPIKIGPVSISKHHQYSHHSKTGSTYILNICMWNLSSHRNTFDQELFWNEHVNRTERKALARILELYLSSYTTATSLPFSDSNYIWHTSDQSPVMFVKPWLIHTNLHSKNLQMLQDRYLRMTGKYSRIRNVKFLHTDSSVLEFDESLQLVAIDM
jgi:hypothetical protein